MYGVYRQRCRPDWPAANEQREQCASGLKMLQTPGFLSWRLILSEYTATTFAAGSWPCFAEVATEIWYFFEDADILGYNNLAYDGAMLAAEFKRTEFADVYQVRECCVL